LIFTQTNAIVLLALNFEYTVLYFIKLTRTLQQILKTLLLVYLYKCAWY